MNKRVKLPDDVQDFVDAQLQSGAYASADDLVADAVRRLANEVADDADAEALRELVQESLNDPRPSIPAEEVWRRLDEQATQRRAR
jgi:antitoxin ParD1/3/4